MVVARTDEKDGVRNLTAQESRQAFEDELKQRLGKDAQTFIDEWRAGKLDREDPNVNFLLPLLPIYGRLPKGA